jgi:hypothetical protein
MVCSYNKSVPGTSTGTELNTGRPEYKGMDSSVGIATELRGQRSGDRIQVERRDFPHPSRPAPVGSPSLLYNVYRVTFPGGKAAGAWR